MSCRFLLSLLIVCDRGRFSDTQARAAEAGMKTLLQLHNTDEVCAEKQCCLPKSFVFVDHNQYMFSCVSCAMNWEYLIVGFQMKRLSPEYLRWYDINVETNVFCNRGQWQSHIIHSSRSYTRKSEENQIIDEF